MRASARKIKLVNWNALLVCVCVCARSRARHKMPMTNPEHSINCLVVWTEEKSELLKINNFIHRMDRAECISRIKFSHLLSAKFILLPSPRVHTHTQSIPTITWLLCLVGCWFQFEGVNTPFNCFVRFPTKSSDRSTKTTTTHYTVDVNCDHGVFQYTHTHTRSFTTQTSDITHTALLSAVVGSFCSTKINTANSSSKRLNEYKINK